MAKAENKVLSLDDFDAVKASSNPFEFEYMIDGKVPSGFFISVAGEQDPTFAAEWAAWKAGERARIQSLIASGVPYAPTEQEITENAATVAALRFRGWRGVKEEFARDAAQKLCARNVQIANQATAQAQKLENFMKL